MKILDRIAADLMLLFGAIHSAFSPPFHGHYDDAGMWFLSGGLMMSFLGLLNLVRSASPGDASRGAALVANVLGLAFMLALVPIYPPRQNPQVAIFIALTTVAILMCFTRRDGSAR